MLRIRRTGIAKGLGLGLGKHHGGGGGHHGHHGGGGFYYGGSYPAYWGSGWGYPWGWDTGCVNCAPAVAAPIVGQVSCFDKNDKPTKDYYCTNNYTGQQSEIDLCCPPGERGRRR